MTDSSKRLGYGGSAEVDGVQVLITSGGFETTDDITFLEMLDIDPTAGTSRSKVKFADGVESYSGTVSLDVTSDFLTVLTTSKLLARAYSFSVGINDGEDAQMMDGCYVSSLSLSGSPGGLITATISFQSASAPYASLLVANSFIRDQVPYGYWYSGNTDVRDWTFSMNQSLTPVYSNENVKAPKYIRVGLFDFSLDVTTYEAVVAHDTIGIATKTFVLKGATTSRGYEFGGSTDLGSYKHTFGTAADITVGSGDIIIS